jgi:hypothetical protein
MIKFIIFSMFFISYFEMMLKWDWNHLEMSQDYFIYKIFQHEKKQLEIILYVTYLKCSGIPDVPKKHVSSNYFENISNYSCPENVPGWLFKAYTNPSSASKVSIRVQDPGFSVRWVMGLYRDLAWSLVHSEDTVKEITSLLHDKAIAKKTFSWITERPQSIPNSFFLNESINGLNVVRWKDASLGCDCHRAGLHGEPLHQSERRL